MPVSQEGNMFLLCGLIAVAQGAASDFSDSPEWWTCGAQDWGPNEARNYTIKEPSAEGGTCVSLNYTFGYEHYLAFPKWRNAGWDLSQKESLTFKVRVPGGTSWRAANPTVYLRNQDGSFVRLRPANGSLMLDMKPDEWRQITVPLAPSADWQRIEWLGGSLKKVDFVELAFSGGGPGGAAHHVLVDAVTFNGGNPAYTPPDENLADLDVLMIERTPTYERYNLPDYNADFEIGKPSNLAAKHQPTKGEKVTFTAKIQNKGKAESSAAYKWILDGKVVGSGRTDALPPRASREIEIEWAWDPADHDLTFELTPDKPDFCPANNGLTIRTNALLLKFMVERGLIARMEQKTNMVGSYSLEDWVQGQVRFMNQLFAESKYDFAPKGIEQRVMVGRIEYVDDGHLPTLGAGPFKVGEFDTTVDGGRGLTALDDPWNSGAGAPCFMNFIGRQDDAWLHELSHQIGVIDDYQFITEPEDNQVNGVGFNYKNTGLMGGGDISPYPSLGTLYSLYSPSNVAGLNATKGHRRGFFGEYLFNMPRECSIRLLGQDGKPLANAEVKVFQVEGRKIDTKPEQQGRTDANGVLKLVNRKVEGGPYRTATGCELRDNPFGFIHVVGFNGVALVTADTPSGPLYGFYSVPEFNVEFARGNKDKATIPVRLQPKGDERWYYGRL